MEKIVMILENDERVYDRSGKDRRGLKGEWKVPESYDTVGWWD